MSYRRSLYDLLFDLRAIVMPLRHSNTSQPLEVSLASCWFHSKLCFAWPSVLSTLWWEHSSLPQRSYLPFFKCEHAFKTIRGSVERNNHVLIKLIKAWTPQCTSFMHWIRIIFFTVISHVTLMDKGTFPINILINDEEGVNFSTLKSL